ncbi:MAG TPA: alpha/beta fold hydrolase [Acidimicrobiales bacterium]|nr:alpha/beta fold hydrolase [Acidimicrobiales bacterium]
MLYLETRGRGPRLVLVHGFTQTGRSWGRAGDLLAARHELVTLDAPGHGRSAAIEAGLADGADLMAAAVRTTGGPATWLGYSMGGRFALHVAWRHPDLVERLVLVSASAGIDDPAERARRRDSDDLLARRIEQEGKEQFLEWWLAQPLFATLPTGAAGVHERLEGPASGWASSLRRAGTGTQEPLWGRLRELAMPVLVIAGGLDHKYRDLARRIGRETGPNATVVILEGAGHACHLERPDEFADVVGTWLRP